MTETTTPPEKVVSIGLKQGQSQGRPKRPAPPGKAPNWTSETAKEARKKSLAVQALQHQAGKKQGPLSRAEWEALAHRPSFSGNWFRTFQSTLRRLRKQYAPPGSTETAQYALLIERLAAVYTLAWRIQAEDQDGIAYDLVLKLDAQIKDYISQIQKYTESEKRELTIKDDLQQQFLSTTVVLAEATISDLSARESFLISLMRQFLGESAAQAVARSSATQTKQAKLEAGAVIEHEAKG